MRVLTVLITAGRVEPECLAAVRAQTHAGGGWLVVGHPPEHAHPDPVVRTYRNCSANRNRARRLALASDADAFLFVDSDVVLPPTAVASFVRQAAAGDKHVLGGWYKMIHADKWVAGRWVADHVFVNAKAPQPSLTMTDLVGCGCLFVTRRVLAEIEFEHGTDVTLSDEFGNPVLLGECGAFGNRCAERGYAMYMDGDVICQHLVRRKEEAGTAPSEAHDGNPVTG